MRSGSVAAVVLLVLVAAAGVFGVRELTEPAPRAPIGPIQLDAGARGGDELRDGEGGFDAPSAARPGAGSDGAPDGPSPQIEVRTPDADDGEEGD